ncbi:beta-glucan synthesis-associated protein [Dispira simplex]|nr:beta-glucan synthesis-associated protein [Dispira simplex]
MTALKEKISQKAWWSPRGWCNVLVLVFIVLTMLSLFIIYPILQNYVKFDQKSTDVKDENHQYQPLKPDKLPIDPDTPKDALTRTTYDGEEYTLVFSDEFNKDGRSFFPGDDPYWEAVDLWYWPTMDMEYYKPEQVFTKDGNLVLQMDKIKTGTLDYRSGMLQSWNKFCFQGGLLEVNVSMPFRADVSGLWPAAWALGNLGRAGYGASTDGMWPYTYDTCDLGVMVNQTNPAMSYLTGQRLNKCVCKGDHPNPGKGRGAPEIDIFEGSGGIYGKPAQVSQSLQVAPFDFRYEADFSHATLYNPKTEINKYKGGPFQQALSGVTPLDPEWFGGKGYQTYAFQYTPGTNGKVAWFVGESPTWSITADTVGPNHRSAISQRVIPEEPMYIILNLGMATGFSTVEIDKMEFPTAMYVDYVRLYQPKDQIAISCDTKEFPTREYISKHEIAYTNNNLTRWSHAQFEFPDYSLDDKC